MESHRINAHHPLTLVVLIRIRALDYIRNVCYTGAFRNACTHTHTCPHPPSPSLFLVQYVFVDLHRCSCATLAPVCTCACPVIVRCCLCPVGAPLVVVAISSHRHHDCWCYWERDRRPFSTLLLVGSLSMVLVVVGVYKY